MKLINLSKYSPPVCVHLLNHSSYFCSVIMRNSGFEQIQPPEFVTKSPLTMQ